LAEQEDHGAGRLHMSAEAFPSLEKFWASRTSASILRAAGLPELVGETLEDFIALSVSLAKSPDRLLDLRRNMRSRLRDSPVCDTLSFARNMEALYTRICMENSGVIR